MAFNGNDGVDTLPTNKVVPVVNDQPQVIFQPPTAAELNKVAEVPETKGSSRSIGTVVPTKDALTKNTVKLSKYMKQRMPHQGFVENPITMKTAPSYETTTVTLDDGTTVEARAYVAPEERNIIQHPYASTKDNHTLTKNGTFTVTESETEFGPRSDVRYNDDGISTSEKNDLIQPIPALAADKELEKQLDRHWRQGEDEVTPINKDNYLSRPGSKIVTSETFLSDSEEIKDDSEGEKEGEEG